MISASIWKAERLDKYTDKNTIEYLLNRVFCFAEEQVDKREKMTIFFLLKWPEI